MNAKVFAVNLLMLALVGVASANDVRSDNECHDPVDMWQPKDALREHLENEGWTVFRIKIEHGCYEVKGINAEGQRVDAEFSPSTFELIEMESD